MDGHLTQRVAVDDLSHLDEFERIAVEYERLHPSPPPPPPPPPLTAEQLEALRRQALARKLEQHRKEIEAAHKAWAAAYPKACGVPKMFAHKRFDTFECTSEQQRAAVDACHEFLETWQERQYAGEHTSLWILGTMGTGKTRLAAALVTALYLDDGVEALLIQPKHMIDRLRDTWERGAKEKHRDVLREFIEVEVLVLDDVGTSWGSEAEKVQLFEIIDGRYADGRPTLLTSNKQPMQLRDAIGERAYDRLRHGARVVPLTGESYRRPKA